MKKNITDYKVLLWDFDGVIMDSMHVRDSGFSEVLKDYPKEQVEQLLTYHRANGGLSRYVKFRHFFEEIRNESITAEQLQILADSFSDLMLSRLIKKELLIRDSLAFIQSYYQKYTMHIVSGSDGVELRSICTSLHLNLYFETINGSPTPKKQLVKDVIENHKYAKEDVALIGDSINDYEAAYTNNIAFWGYNNIKLAERGLSYIHKFSER